MLSAFPTMPVLAVADLERARAFYETVLGLAVVREGVEGVQYGVANGTVLVYPSAYAGTNKATAVSFQVPGSAFDDEVAGLRAAGVVFQTFEMDGLTWSDGVATMGATRSVWFADPDGNVLNLETGA